MASPASPVSETRLRRTVIGGRRGELVDVPILGSVWLELPGARAWQEIEAAVRVEMRRLEFGDLSLTNAAAYEVEMAIRVLTQAARDPDDHSQPYGTLEEWGGLDNDVINYAWHVFGDVRERLDPIACELTEDDAFAIQTAVKKKDGPRLRSYGVARLVAWLVTTADPPSTSPTPSSPSSESQPVTSES